MRVLSTRIMANELGKHMNNAIEAAKHNNNGNDDVKQRNNDL